VPQPRVDVAARTSNDLGECPVWLPRLGSLVWLDVRRRRLQRLDPGTGALDCRSLDQVVTAVAPHRDDRLVAAVADGFGWVAPTGGAVTALARVEDPSVAQMNDGACDRDGRFWAGSASVRRDRRDGSLWRLDRDGTAHRVLRQVGMSNGLDWSPGGDRMYYVDTASGGVDVFDLDRQDGTLRGRRRLVDIPSRLGKPDGLTVDADGCLWLAIWGSGQVHRYDPDGGCDRVLWFPADRVTSCAFGGSALDVLFVTSARSGMTPRQLAAQPRAGDLFAVRLGVSGLPPVPFAGNVGGVAA